MVVRPSSVPEATRAGPLSAHGIGCGSSASRSSQICQRIPQMSSMSTSVPRIVTKIDSGAAFGSGK
jgi:hypothetical protein